MVFHRLWQAKLKEKRIRMTIAIQPTKMNLYRKIAEAYGWTMSALSESLIDQFLAKEIFSIRKKYTDGMVLTKEEKELFDLIKEQETCQACGIRRIEGGFTDSCEICKLEKELGYFLAGRKFAMEKLEKDAADPSTDEEDRKYAKMTLRKIKDGTYNFGSDDEMEKIQKKLEILKAEEEEEREYKKRKEIEDKYKDELKNIRGFKKRFDFITSKVKQEESTK